MTILDFFFFVFFSYILGHLYRYVYSNYNKKNLIPTGFGFILSAIVIVWFFFKSNQFFYINYFHQIYLIFILSFIYWFDDLFGLSALFRFFLQFLMGFGITYLTIENNILLVNYLYLISSLMGILSIIFCNAINFYDGLDLNISIFIVINAILIIFFASSTDLIYLTLILFASTIGFSLINIFPKSLYFGDSGCFFITSFILFIFIIELKLNNLEILLVLAGLSLPIIDFVYVNVFRLYLGENLLSRNFYYLYQEFNAKYKNQVYLLLQPANTLLIIFTYHILLNSGFSFFLAVFLSCLAVTAVFYTISRLIILRR